MPLLDTGPGGYKIFNAVIDAKAREAFTEFHVRRPDGSQMRTVPPISLADVIGQIKDDIEDHRPRAKVLPSERFDPEQIVVAVQTLSHAVGQYIETKSECSGTIVEGTQGTVMNCDDRAGTVWVKFDLIAPLDNAVWIVPPNAIEWI